VRTEAGKDLNELSAIAAGTGPGSYTGLRIGLSAAKGLCFGLDAPISGMPTLEILVYELRSGQLKFDAADVLHPMIDARRMEVFSALFTSTGSAISESRPVLLSDEQCAALPSDKLHIVFGDGADKATELWARHAHIQHVPGVRPSALGLSACAHAYFLRNAFSDLAYLVPEYGKEANVAQPKAQRPQ
jgi:tRNA threonylcarbamoyladenosine biosynthesis protein TsaB